MTFEIAEVDEPMNRSGRIYPRKLWEAIEKEKDKKYEIHIGTEENDWKSICGLVDKIWINEQGQVMANAEMLESCPEWNTIADMIKGESISPDQIKLFPDGEGICNMVDDKPIVSDYELKSFTVDVEPKKE